MPPRVRQEDASLRALATPKRAQRLPQEGPGRPPDSVTQESLLGDTVGGFSEGPVGLVLGPFWNRLGAFLSPSQSPGGA